MPMQFPAPSTLGDIFEMNPGAYWEAQKALDLGTQQNQADLRKTQLANMFDEQNDPLRVQHQRLSNQSLEAQIPGMQADSRSKGLKADRDAATQQATIEADLSKLKAALTDNDIKQLENHARGMALSKDPSVRQQGEFWLGQTKEMIEERIKHAQKLEVIGAQGDNASRLQREGLAGGRYNTSRGPSDFWGSVASGKYKKATDLHAAIIAERARLAATNPEDPDIGKLDQMAAAVRPQAEAEIATAKPGSINTGAVAGLPVNPPPQIAPNNPAAASPTANQATFQKAFGSYEPQKYDYRIGPNGVPQRKLRTQ